MPTPLSSVALCNLALSRIGVLQQIQSLTPPDNTPAGVACSAAYQFAKQDLLHQFPWAWASAYAQLAVLTPVGQRENAEWLYAYQYPTNCLFVRRLFLTPNVSQTLPYGTTPWPSGNREDTDAYPCPFEIGYRQGVQVIYTDLQFASCKYTFDQDDTVPFTPDFASVFAWRLAMELAFPLANSQERRDFATKMFDKEKWTAAAVMMNEQQNSQPFVFYNSEFTRGRYDA